MLYVDYLLYKFKKLSRNTDKHCFSSCTDFVLYGQ